MANKQIGDLQLRSDFDDTCSIPVDDSSQTWRVTGAQILDFTRVKSIAAKTANYTLTGDDDFLTGDATAGAFTFTLPAASSLPGHLYSLMKTDSSANAITVGSVSSLRVQGESVRVVSNGTDWLEFDHHYPTIAARASQGAANPIPVGVILWQVADYNPHGSYATGTGGFTVRVAGEYRVSCVILYSSAAGTSYVTVQKNGSDMARLFDGQASGPHSGTATVTCAVGDVLRIYNYTAGIPTGGNHTASNLYQVSFERIR
jgi:hypothetical protein